LILTIGREEILRMSYSHLPFHTPLKAGKTRWKIVDNDTGEVVDKYTPPKPPVYHPPKWAGSWAETMQRR